MSITNENVIVSVRCRPFNEKEKERGEGAKRCAHIAPEKGSVTLQSPKNEEDTKQFTFDAAFDDTCTQVSNFTILYA